MYYWYVLIPTIKCNNAIGIANVKGNEASYTPSDKDRQSISCVLSSHEDHNIAGLFVLKKVL